MAGPLISAMPDVRRRFPAALAAEEDERDLRTQHHFAVLQQALNQANELQRSRKLRGDELAFVPGQGFVSPREMLADYVLRMGDIAPPSREGAGDYEFVPNQLIEGTHGLVEGILAGLTTGEDGRPDFFPEFQKGVMGLVMPERGVDEATKERLYGRMGPIKRMAMENLTSPVNYLWPMASMRTSAGRHVASIPAFLETTSGERIRKLLPASGPPGRRVMPLALP